MHEVLPIILLCEICHKPIHKFAIWRGKWAYHFECTLTRWRGFYVEEMPASEPIKIVKHLTVVK